MPAAIRWLNVLNVQWGWLVDGGEGRSSLRGGACDGHLWWRVVVIDAAGWAVTVVGGWSLGLGGGWWWGGGLGGQ